MIKNFKLVIEYDGTAYSGWQRQKNDRTIQEEIEKAIGIMTRQKVKVIGSGRTDAGVHALGQVANFVCDTKLTSDAFLKGLNSLLPEDIVIRSCQMVDLAFHSRFDALTKAYCYNILNCSVPAAIGRQYVWHIRRPLNTCAMAEASGYFVGTRDFKAFEGSGSPRAHTVRTVTMAELSVGHDGKITFDIEANGFLRFMVRNIVGTLVDIGTGQLSIHDIPEIFGSKDRGRASATAPPQGLFLMSVTYP